MKTTKRKKAAAVEPFVISDSMLLIADAAKANAKAVREIEKKLAMTEQQMFRRVSKHHSDVLTLLDPHLRGDESYYDCMKRILKKR